MAGKGGPRPNAGRKPGSPNKKTIARAEAAARQVEKARATGQKLGTEVLREFMNAFAGLAAMHQPLPAGTPIPPGRDPNEEKFEKWAKLAITAAADLAPFEQARFGLIRFTGFGAGLPGGEPPAGPGTMPVQPKIVEGRVTSIDDPGALARAYKGLMARPKV